MTNEYRSADKPRGEEQPTTPTGKENESKTPAAATNCGKSNSKSAQDNFDLGLCFNGLLFLAAVFQFGAMLWQLRVMQGQLDEMRDEQRPWIGAPEIEVAETDIVTFGLTFSNSGKLPTTDLYIDAKIIDGNGDTLREMNRQCDQGRKLMTKKSERDFVYSIVPGGIPFEMRKAPSMNPNFAKSGDPSGDLIISRSKLERMYSADGVYPQIAGCVLYGIPGQSSLRKTQFYISLTRGQNDKIKRSGSFAVNAN